MWFLRRTRSNADEEATLALTDAEKNLRRIKRRDREVKEVSESLREVRQQNHFAEAMEEIIMQKREAT
jgi:hypothetical protein